MVLVVDEFSGFSDFSGLAVSVVWVQISRTVCDINATFFGTVNGGVTVSTRERLLTGIKSPWANARVRLTCLDREERSRT